MAGHDDEADLTPVLEQDFAAEFPWASDEAVHGAAELVSAHMTSYRENPSFTMARLLAGMQVGYRVADIVGRPNTLVPAAATANTEVLRAMKAEWRSRRPGRADTR